MDKLDTYTIECILDRQLSKEQIELLDELQTALDRINGASLEDAFNSEAPNHNVFDVCYEEDTNNLIARVKKEFDCGVHQLNCSDYWTDHDDYENLEDELDCKDELIHKIEKWIDEVNEFIDDLRRKLTL